MSYLIVKWAHIVSSTILFGTGLGSAFYMFFLSRTRDPRIVAAVVRYVVLADWIFTTPTVFVQPATGLYLVHLANFDLRAPWLLGSITLFILAGAAWLPVVWVQIRMRDLAQEAERNQTPLPQRYWSFLRLWVTLGVVAFASILCVFYLMVVKP